MQWVDNGMVQYSPKCDILFSYITTISIQTPMDPHFNRQISCTRYQIATMVAAVIIGVGSKEQRKQVNKTGELSLQVWNAGKSADSELSG